MTLKCWASNPSLSLKYYMMFIHTLHFSVYLHAVLGTWNIVFSFMFGIVVHIVSSCCVFSLQYTPIIWLLTLGTLFLHFLKVFLLFSLWNPPPLHLEHVSMQTCVMDHIN